jgi:hypothetical protein
MCCHFLQFSLQGRGKAESYLLVLGWHTPDADEADASGATKTTGQKRRAPAVTDALRIAAEPRQAGRGLED